MLNKLSNIEKLKADKNELILLKALSNKGETSVQIEAVKAIRSVGSVVSLKKLDSILENQNELIELRIEVASTMGEICKSIMESHDQMDLDSLSKSELKKYKEENEIVFAARVNLRKVLNDGPKELSIVAANACMSLPLEKNSSVMKAFSNNIDKNPTENADNSEAKLDEKKEDLISNGTNEAEIVSKPHTSVETEINKEDKFQIKEREVKMLKPNLDEAVEIAPNTYWVGIRDDTLLERNIYLRVFKNGDKTVNLLIDPGPPEDLTPLVKKLSSVIGGIRNLHVMFLNHQDPDVSYNSGHLQKLNPNCVVLCSEDSWRLVKFYGLDPKKYKAIESFKDMAVTLSTGHKIRFIPTPYCHFRGAVALFDEETGILFSGDFLGGLSFKQDLYATEESWDGIATFHQIYMPSQAALKHAVNNIRAMDKTPGIIAPQHGSILTGELVQNFLGKIESLEVGLDLFLKEHTKKNYISALNELLAEFSQIVDSTIIPQALSAFLADGSFPNAITVGTNGITDIKVDAQYAVEIFLRELREKTPSNLIDLVDISIVRVLTMWKIVLPEFMLEKSSVQESVFK